MDSPSTKTKTPATTEYSSMHLTLHHGRPERPQPASVAAGYRECRKNHAAPLGRVALDGCREFMASTGSSVAPATADVPAFLICAACGCHRNFHRRDVDYRSDPSSPPSPRPLSPIPTSYYVPPSPWMHRAPGIWNSGLIPELASSLLSDGDVDDDMARRLSGTKERRKRERTKFSKEQKEKMEAFARKMGWKMKSDDGADDGNGKAVEEFCREVGVSRGVLRVWMNNHKHKHKTLSSNEFR